MAPQRHSSDTSLPPDASAASALPAALSVRPAISFPTAGRDAFREKAERDARKRSEQATRRKGATAALPISEAAVAKPEPLQARQEPPVAPIVPPEPARAAGRVSLPADPQRASAAIIPWPVRARVKKPVLASTDAPPVERPAPTEPPKVDAPDTAPKPAQPATLTPASAPFSAAKFWGAKKKSGGGGSSGGGGASDGGHKDGPFDQDDVAGAVIVLLILLLIGWMLFNLGGKPSGDDRLLEPQSALNAPAPQAPVVKPDPFPAGPIDLKPKSPMPEAAPVQAAPAPVASEPVVTAQAMPSPPTPAVQPAKATCAPGHMIHAYFCTSRSDLTPAARSALDAELEQWRSCAAGQELVVKGYADTRGSQALNLALGENRAKQLADILRAQGLNVSAVVGIGKLDGLDDGQNCLNQRRVDVGLKSEIDAATPSKACAPPRSVVPIVCESAAPKPDAADASPAR